MAVSGYGVAGRITAVCVCSAAESARHPLHSAAAATNDRGRSVLGHAGLHGVRVL
jgi:hypothetical protein